MGLAPSPHPSGTLAIAEVRKVLGFTIPSPLTGELTGPATLRLAAVMLMLPVPVIREEKRAATAALTSLRLWAHREPKPTQPPPESKQNNGAEEEPEGRSKKSFQEKILKKRPRKKNGISDQRISGNIIPPLTISISVFCFLLSLRGGFARPFDVGSWMFEPRLRSATFIQPAPSIPALAAFCPCRRGHASGSPVIPRRVPEVDHEIPFICRALPLLFGFLAVCRGRGNQKSSAAAALPMPWALPSMVLAQYAPNSSKRG